MDSIEQNRLVMNMKLSLKNRLKFIMFSCKKIPFISLYLCMIRLYVPLLSTIEQRYGKDTLLTQRIFTVLTRIMRPVLYIYHWTANWD